MLLRSVNKRRAGTSVIVIVLTMLIWMWSRDPYEVVTSPDILQEIYGCYYVNNVMVIKLNSNGSVAGNGWFMRYKIVSFKGELKFFPERGLLVTSEAGGRVSVVESGGAGLYYEVRRGPVTEILLFADRVHMYWLHRGQCA